MYEILRVPPGPGHMKKAYDMIIAYIGDDTGLTWDDFYKSTKSVYMISDNKFYHGMGWVCHKECPIYMRGLMKVRPFGDNVYAMNILTFNEEGLYNKVFDIVRTLMRDCMDRMIIVENVPNISTPEVVNALKNNGFKSFKGTNQYSSTYYRIPGLKTVEKKFKLINQRDDKETIDKYICLCDNTDREQELRDKYTRDLINKNLAENAANVCPCCGMIDCQCGNNQTAEEFLGKDNCYCNK